MAHTLTFTSVFAVTINGNAVTSPYTLQHGDTIVASWSSNLGTVTVNGTACSDNAVLDLSNTDISITMTNTGACD